MEVNQETRQVKEARKTWSGLEVNEDKLGILKKSYHLFTLSYMLSILSYLFFKLRYNDVQHYISFRCTTLFWGGSKITADGDCSHEIKRRLLLGRKFLTNLNSILKSRDITLSTKFRLVKAMIFPVVVYECESWTIKKSVYQKIVAFELLRWRRLLRIPWTARKSNQSILKEISPEYSLEGLMLKLQYFGQIGRASCRERV